jgi:hypothetical protein
METSAMPKKEEVGGIGVAAAAAAAIVVVVVVVVVAGLWFLVEGRARARCVFC